MRRRKIIGGAVLGAVLFWALLSIPPSDPPLPQGAAGTPFAWRQDWRWKALEASFREARAADPEGLKGRVEGGFRRAGEILESLSAAPAGPDAQALSELEGVLFGLGALVAASPGGARDYIDLVTKTRSLLKVRSRSWDMGDGAVRDRLYRLLYGGRASLEEVMLQAPAGSFPALVHGDPEASATPSFSFRDCVLHSGDILVSRGGAPTSALIARGNDYPGNFSHVALLHVDDKTGVPGIVESHIEKGVGISAVEEYLGDKKLRIMVLRLRSDLPAVRADPLLPHRAARVAHEEAAARHIPYDFRMDTGDASEMFCSEVVSNAYGRCGVGLWKGTTRISAPGVVKWLSCFGVTRFETQAPADLEYDPQLVVVAEWRDPEALWQDHVDNAVLDALLEGADGGEGIRCPWWKLAPARLAKAFSAVLNVFGGAGPIPEGMDAAAAVRSVELSALHGRVRERVLAEAAAFGRERGYRAPYWELVRIAGKARAEVRGSE